MISASLQAVAKVAAALADRSYLSRPLSGRPKMRLTHLYLPRNQPVRSDYSWSATGPWRRCKVCRGRVRRGRTAGHDALDHKRLRSATRRFDSDEMTALKFAVKRCKPEVIRHLIDEGAPVDGPKRTRQTALVLAARANNVENVKVLIDNGADPKTWRVICCENR